MCFCGRHVTSAVSLNSGSASKKNFILPLKGSKYCLMYKFKTAHVFRILDGGTSLSCGNLVYCIPNEQQEFGTLVHHINANSMGTRCRQASYMFLLCIFGVVETILLLHCSKWEENSPAHAPHDPEPW